MLGGRLEDRRHLVGEVVAVVLAAERPLDVLQRLVVVAPRERDALDLQRAAVRADPS